MTVPPRLCSTLMLVTLLLVAAPAAAPGQDTGWTITSFEAEYVVHPDRTIEVLERIAVDFGTLERHGIYRTIPVKYRKVVRVGLPIDAGTVKTGIRVESITDSAGRPVKKSSLRDYRVQMRIGDPDQTLTGKQTFVFRYRITNGLGFFDDHDELYWQVTGTEWPVPILKASATVQIVAPSESALGSGWEAWCYVGRSESSSGERCTAAVTGTGAYRFDSGRLEPGEGFTMVAAFPKSVVAAPTRAERLTAMAITWWPAALPIMALLGSFALWWSRGRAPSAGSIVPIWRPPEGIPPGAAGTLVDQRADMKDVVATLLDLAVRGYIRIHEVPPQGLAKLAQGRPLAMKAMRSLRLVRTDWELERTEREVEAGALAHYEMRVLESIFDGLPRRRMSDLHNNFYQHLPIIQNGMYELLVQEGYFFLSPKSVRTFYNIVGIGVLIIGGLYGIRLSNGILVLCAVLTALIVRAFRSAMPAMTPEGARRWREVKGLEEYIRRAEKLELEASQAPERTTELFELLLPYAVALKVSHLWMEQFATALAASPPTWYSGNSPDSFDMSGFQRDLSNFQTAASRTLGSAPGSSSGSDGGGSVGGGGGGGGGGSW